MAEFRHIVILTGAGLSAESGISTFRDRNGIWAKYDFSEVATPEGFQANPQLVHDFYNQRRRGLLGVGPNASHFALARLEREHKGSVTVVTQNIDHLHEEAGSRNLIHMHGELLKALCALCGARHRWMKDIGLTTQCPACEKKGGMRPDVVWFGEVPYEMDRIYEALVRADLFISIGTSGNVYPAAGFVAATREAGAHTVELNLEPSDGAHLFHEAIHGPATQIVPAYVERLLASR
jgi:NAD-dependent deacetylase